MEGQLYRVYSSDGETDLICFLTEIDVNMIEIIPDIMACACEEGTEADTFKVIIAGREVFFGIERKEYSEELNVTGELVILLLLQGLSIKSVSPEEILSRPMVRCNVIVGGGQVFRFIATDGQCIANQIGRLYTVESIMLRPIGPGKKFIFRLEDEGEVVHLCKEQCDVYGVIHHITRPTFHKNPAN